MECSVSGFQLGLAAISRWSIVRTQNRTQYAYACARCSAFPVEGGWEPLKITADAKTLLLSRLALRSVALATAVLRKRKGTSSSFENESHALACNIASRS